MLLTIKYLHINNKIFQSLAQLKKYNFKTFKFIFDTLYKRLYIFSPNHI